MSAALSHCITLISPLEPTTVCSLCTFKANKGKQIHVQIGRAAQSTPERLEKKNFFHSN